MKMRLPLVAAVVFTLIVKCSADGHGIMGLMCEENKGWFKGWDKCYKIFHGEHIRSYLRAEEMCESFGSRLVVIRDQPENNLIGKKFTELNSSVNTYYIGLAKKKTGDCSNCEELKWSNGMSANDIEGFWSDNEPDDSDGGCVFVQKNDEDYCYDRPYTFSYCNCMTHRAFVCEKMAAPEDSFFCLKKGYINKYKTCDGRNDCEDGSDELNCERQCRYYHTGDDGNLGPLDYSDAQTCTWAIETSPGTNAIVEFDNFNTEYNADFVTIMTGSFDESEAMIVGRISGNLGKKTYRSYNNKIFVKFSSDSSVSRSSSITGFTGTYRSLKVPTKQVVNLVAQSNPKDYAISTFDIANMNTFLGQRDYVIIISTENDHQFGEMITLEVLDLKLADGDTVMFFDHENPQNLVSTSCNDLERCDNNKVVYSTDKKLSILLRTSKTIDKEMAFRFRYRSGCYYETSMNWGTIYTPGYTGKINYPSSVTCTWQITTDVPISIYFDPASKLQSNAHNRRVNGDFLKISENGQMLNSSSTSTEFTTNDIAGKVISLKTGVTKIQLDSSVTRSERGFLATWSPACPDPMYDENTIVSPSPLKMNYRDVTTVSCKIGYAFQQEQIASGTSSVNIECGFKGVWKNYSQVPRCTPRYCGDVPASANGIIVSSTGTVYGSKVTYKCNAGTVAIGSLEISCREDGTWESAPTCRADACPSGDIGETILNGKGVRKFGDGTSIGTIYEYECNDGYEFVGSPYIICQDDAKWSQDKEPSCKLLTCLLPSIEKVEYTSSAAGQLVNVGVESFVRCPIGYKLATDSPTMIKCNTDRSLSTLPQCIDVNECDDNNICSFKCENTEGSYYCTCDKGFQLSFDGRNCIDIDECQSNHNCDGTCIDEEGSYRCECNLPYVLYTKNMISGFEIPPNSGEFGNLPTDTYHINHSCVLMTCPPPASISNGKILTKRDYHRYGDHIEYVCDIGYTPLRSERVCGLNGQWLGNVPKCEPANCVENIPIGLQTAPTIDSGPTFDYGDRLTLQCKLGDNSFQRYRFCTYNAGTDQYEMQGSNYDCGVIDCGVPKQWPGSSYSTPSVTTFGSSFFFTCQDNTREGKTQAGSESEVFCLKEGYWDFGYLQCTGLKCLDPTYPPDGNIIATSFADKSTVKFECLRRGYTLSRDVTLTCNRDNFFSNNEQIPECRDTENPVFNNCPSRPITLRRYDSLSDILKSLPQITVTDNTAVRSFTISPSNANSTYFVSQKSNVQVEYTATDFANNQETCRIDVVVTDEEPPLLTCLDRTVFLDTVQDEEEYVKLKVEDVVSTNQRDEIDFFNVIGEPLGVFRAVDLYKSYTYTVEVRDKAGNSALCRQQIFVQPRPCSELSYPTPLNAQKSCRESGLDRICELTCDDSYTFEDGKSKTVRCSNGNWGTTPWIPACVKDVTLPVVTCPPSRSVTDLSTKTATREIDFDTDLRSSVLVQDLNIVGTPEFSPSKYTFTAADVYKPKVITVSVQDLAGNTGSCTFQYTVVPPVCSELSLRTPIDGSISGTRRSRTSSRSAGWDVTITCNNGKILRNVGASTTVSCDDGSEWSDADIFPICIFDTAGPSLTCPQSSQEIISTGNEVRLIDFKNSAKYAGISTDLSGIKEQNYQPPSLEVNFNRLNNVQNVRLTVVDNANNPSFCDFQVAIIAAKCSPLALPDPLNGKKECTKITNGWRCTVSCNDGYSLYSTSQAFTTTTCQNDGDFDTYIPDCASNNEVIDKEFIATLSYQYVPVSSTVTTIPELCETFYKNSRTAALESMSNRLKTSCSNNFGVNGQFEPDFVLRFLPDATVVKIDGRTVSMNFSYTIKYSDTSIYDDCALSFIEDIGKIGNTYPLSQNIELNVGTCPDLQWNNIATGAGRGSFCTAPYFVSLTLADKCVKCPRGTQSNSIVCSVCPKGTFRGSENSCTSCPTGYTTRYPGAIGSDKCIAPCIGTVSTTGFSPCISCQKGFYRFNSLNCQSCGTGQTTAGDGAISSSQCVSSTVDDVPCTIGTQLNGNTCEPCERGTYRNGNSQTCVTCGTSGNGIDLKGATSINECSATCSDGYTSSTGFVPCSPCPPGQYFVSTTKCENCPVGFTTKSSGQSVCVPTNSFRLNCPKGTQRINELCENCPIGKYNSGEESSCTSCPNSQETTFFTGATAQTMCRSKCPPGFSSATGRPPCQPCGIGKYSSQYGAQSCTSCSAVLNEMITATTTSTSQNDCIAKCNEGYFSLSGYDNLNNNQHGACRKCPRNYYQSQKGQTICNQCPSTSTYSTTDGLTASSQCLNANDRCDNYCLNGGACLIRDNEPVCNCLQGRFSGPRCSETVDNCRSQPCYNNGLCTSTTNGYTCDCGNIATGIRCETLVKKCSTGATPTCRNGGHCINRLNSFECMCTEGYTGTNCDQSVDICVSSPCTINGRCEDISNGTNLRRRCICNPGYTGETCADDVIECKSNPCINGGTCRDSINSFTCVCKTGYSGTFCQIRQDTCASTNCRVQDFSASCVDDYNKNEPMCICNPEYTYDLDGKYVQYQIKLNTGPQILSNANDGNKDTVSECRQLCTSLNTDCKWFAFDSTNNKCYIWNSDVPIGTKSNIHLYTKYVVYPTDDFYTLRYNLKTPTPFSLSDTESLNELRNNYGLDICAGTEPLSVRCCQVGSTCLDNRFLPVGLSCDQNANALSYPSTNKDYDIQFKCSIRRVFSSLTCRQKTDYCSSLTPCQNGGFCSDQFGGYRCSCTAGYTGKNCQTNINDCANDPCQNDATCEDKVNGYQCICTNFYTGRNCESPVNFCTPDICKGNGGCTNVPGSGYICTCNFGYEGKNCEVQTDYCKSDPCQHGGTCSKRLGSFNCECVDGWRGTFCQAPVEKCNDNNAGTRCIGQCFNIFNDYSCKCNDNRFGANCEFERNPCRDYNKCQNNGQCTYDTSMKCNCLTKYTGDGCQTLVDYCGKTNPCMNDAMCSVTDTGYKCTCKQGYEGTNCENEVNDCPADTCPNGGDCFDGVNTYYCRCPIQKTGTNCLKDIDVNYDLSFYHPRGFGFAWIPYYIQVTRANYMSTTLWVRYSVDGDTGVYLTQFMGDRFEEAEKFMEFEERGVKIYTDPANANYRLLEYDREARVNDGNWHLVAVTCDLIKGTASLILDTISHDFVMDSNLIMPNARQWVVLGCEFDNEDMRCDENGKGFRGYISQVNMYTKFLSFEGPDDNTVGDIPRIFTEPRFVFQDLRYLLLAWNEYVYESGVGKMTPSEANSKLCSDNIRSIACSSYRGTSQLPSVTNCPADRVIYSDTRITQVNWDEPSFKNIGRIIKPLRPSGSSFKWGTHRFTYIGIDSSNNTAVCHFTIYLTGGQCDSNLNPRGGTQNCNSQSGRTGCTISCNTVSSNTYMLDRAHPDLFTCGPTGWWNSDKPFQRCRYPSCGLRKSEPKLRAYIRANFRMITAACLASERNIKERTYEALSTMRLAFGESLCQQVDCRDSIVVVTCGDATTQKRRKRQTSSFVTVLLEITLPSINANVVFDGETISSQEFLTYFILGDEILNFESIPNFNMIKENFRIVMTETCPVGEVVRDGSCVECGPGNYFRYTDQTNTTAICDDCPLGYYQDLSGAMSCKQCTTGLTTELTGEFSPLSCKTSCPRGQYFDNNRNSCFECPIGYYQDEVGQFRCKGCEAGETTKETGSESKSQCSVSCDSGSELNANGECDLCDIGQYRDAATNRVCVPCDSGFITATRGARLKTDCKIVDCQIGYYRNATENACKKCPLNTYQNEIRQETCKVCGDQANWRTEDLGSSSRSQCLYYCASGFEVNLESRTSCDICPVEEYKDNNEDPQGRCATCPGNKVSLEKGAKSRFDCTIYICPKGSKANAANTGCEKCEAGYYQDVVYSTSCKKCEPSYSTRDEGSISSDACELYCLDGEEKINDQCRKCKVGFFKDNNMGFFELCKQCDSRYTTADVGSTSATACSIRTCPAGTKIDSTDTGCESCPRGTYQPDAYQKDCIPCDSGTSTRMVNSTKKTDCETYCVSGLEKISGKCEPCPRGYFKDNTVDKFSTCTLCPSDRITENDSATSESFCTIGNCSAGQYLKPDKTCANCPKGQYQPSKWQESCIDCGQDKTTETDGASMKSECIVECSPGFEDINGICNACPRGTFKVERAAAKCKPCTSGTTTVETGATSPNLCTLPACTAGQYLDKVTNPSSPTCKSCAYDTYQDEIWQEECKPCTDNKVTLKVGADKSSDCVSDCDSGRQYNSISGQCEFCPRGYYRDRNERLQPQCQLCPIDKITTGEGAKNSQACTEANCTLPGEYRDTSSNTCKKCPLGTYNSEKWVVSCRDCPLGNSTRAVGATRIEDCISICPLGQYVGSSNNCELCPKGTYRSDGTTEQCKNCPNGLTTEGQGADSETKCSISPCTSGYKYVNNNNCVKCETGTYQPNSGTFQCIDCPFPIKYTPVEGATSEDQCRSPCGAGQQFDVASKGCVACPVGTFQPKALEFTCLQCPIGRKFTSQTGSRSIENCLSYCSQSTANQCSTNATCTVSETNSLGYTCQCFPNYDSVGSLTGRECVHKCDRNFCKNGATCVREPTPSCTCTKWYKGDDCALRLKAEELSDDTLDIVIPVAIAVGGLILFLIILAVCCLCWRRGQPAKGPEPQYSEFNGERFDKGSTHSFSMPYNSRPPSRLMMLQPAPEIVYDNKGYMTENHSVIDTSMIDAAVYEA